MKETFQCTKVEWKCKTRCAEKVLRLAGLKEGEKASYEDSQVEKR